MAEYEDEVVGAMLPPLRRPGTTVFLKHHSVFSDFRIWLREACSASQGEFGYRFIPSYEEVRGQVKRQRRVALSVPGYRRLLIPDGVFSLDKGEKHALFLLEVDRGTEPLTGKHFSSIERKFVMYRAAFDCHAEERYARMFQTEFNGFRVLCIVPNERRLRGFLRLAEKLHLAPLVWVATTALVQARGDLNRAVWAVTSDGPLHALTE